MTDFGLVKEEVIKISSLSENQIDKYDNFILSCVSCIEPLLKDKENENDARIVHFCAVKVYYQIMLTEQNNDGITSFQAGDVSYTVDASAADKAKVLLDIARDDCKDLLQNSSFAFKAV